MAPPKTSVQTWDGIEPPVVEGAPGSARNLDYDDEELAGQNEQLRRCEAEMEARLQRYRELYDVAPVGYVTVDSDGVIVEANLMAANLFGIERRRLYRRSIVWFVDHSQRVLLRSHLRHVFASEDNCACELLIVGPKDARRWVVIDSKRDERRPWYCHCAISDIAERKKTEAELREAHGFLELRVEERTRELERANMALQTELIARRQAESALTASEASLRALASEAALAEQRERKRLASDLHDGLSQLLTLARIKLESARNGNAAGLRSCLRDVRGLLTHAQERAESLTFELSPPLLHDVGLVAASERVAEEITRDYRVDVRVTAGSEHRPADEAVRVTVFRAVRELMLNAAEHARAKIVAVVFDSRADAIVIDIEDDGVGFELRNGNSGFGLSNVRERITYLGGTFKIGARDGGGTKATIVVPIAAANGHEATK